MGRLRLTGIRGVVEGEQLCLDPGQEITLGRSRANKLSLRRTRRFLAEEKGEDQADQSFRSVSRRHALVRVVSEGRVEVEGLGANGTYVDGVRIDRLLLTDLADKAHELRLGPRETVRMEWIKD